MTKQTAPLPDLDVSFVREVDEELRRDQMNKLWKRFGLPLSLAGAILVAGTAGYIWWKGDVLKQNIQASNTLASILGQYNTDDKAKQNGAEIAAKLKDAAATLPDQQAALARLYAVGIDPNNAAELEKIRASSKLSPLYKDLALLVSLQTRMDKDDPATLQKELAPLMQEASPWRYSAREMSALLSIKQKDYPAARTLLLGLKSDANTSSAMTTRVNALLASLPSE